MTSNETVLPEMTGLDLPLTGPVKESATVEPAPIVAKIAKETTGPKRLELLAGFGIMILIFAAGVGTGWAWNNATSSIDEQVFSLHNGSITFRVHEEDSQLCLDWRTTNYGRWTVSLVDSDGDLWSRFMLLYDQVSEWDHTECFVKEEIKAPITVKCLWENSEESQRISIE